ncbi:hypothetical protein N1030_12135 [Desulfovibrio mangrovi]|uniref:hypothetical protein n=1 Tax=Desulfovibrio mangrovi TaxID=2976983 RepID=UPI0022461314|nr:hypothetical protein [Desulfovibrio mangrovi]UZP66356.1 hypothetical protein N1030_12135 [Desulfovibrio mangrovi]
MTQPPSPMLRKLEAMFAALRARGIDRATVITATRDLLHARRAERPGEKAEILACQEPEEAESRTALSA